MITKYNVIKSTIEDLENKLNDASQKGWRVNQIIGPLPDKTEVWFLLILDNVESKMISPLSLDQMRKERKV